MVMVGLPVADVHAGEADGSAHSDVLLAEPGHGEHAIPSDEGEHVHLHHCCPHLVSTTELALGVTCPPGALVPWPNAGLLLPGNPTLPFRPPAA
jgi:hypothetical protein